MKRGEGEAGGWRDRGMECVLLDDHGVTIGRVSKQGCCWRGYVGRNSYSSGRFRRLEDAKQAVERVLSLMVA